ncbi:MAG: hypothetical protein QXF35_03645 [Candidatus Bilamarchaeaceae archaeon]
MPEYKDQKTGEVVKISIEKGFKFPATGAKVLLKSRPPVAKEVSTD